MYTKRMHRGCIYLQLPDNLVGQAFSNAESGERNESSSEATTFVVAPTSKIGGRRAQIVQV